MMASHNFMRYLTRQWSGRRTARVNHDGGRNDPAKTGFGLRQQHRYSRAALGRANRQLVAALGPQPGAHQLVDFLAVHRLASQFFHHRPHYRPHLLGIGSAHGGDDLVDHGSQFFIAESLG